MDDFQNEIVNAIKNAGQRLIDQAEDIVGDGELLRSMRIDIDFDGMEAGTFLSTPIITIKRESLVKM